MIGKTVPAEYQDWARTLHGSTTDVERAVRIEVSGGEHTQNIDITLQPVARYHVSGTIVTENGAVPRDMRVEYASASGMSGELMRVSEDGRFTVSGVAGAGHPPGIREHRCRSADGTPGTERIQLTGRRAGDSRRPGTGAGTYHR
jgi:hypothetical protein